MTSQRKLPRVPSKAATHRTPDIPHAQPPAQHLDPDDATPFSNTLLGRFSSDKGWPEATPHLSLWVMCDISRRRISYISPYPHHNPIHTPNQLQHTNTMSGLPHNEVDPATTQDTDREYCDAKGATLDPGTIDWLLKLGCMVPQKGEKPCICHELTKSLCTCPVPDVQRCSTGTEANSDPETSQAPKSCSPYQAALAASCWTKPGEIRLHGNGAPPKAINTMRQRFNKHEMSLFEGYRATVTDIAETLKWYQDQSHAAHTRLFGLIKSYRDYIDNTHKEQMSFPEATYRFINRDKDELDLAEISVVDGLSAQWLEFATENPDIHTTFTQKLAETVANRKTAEAIAATAFDDTSALHESHLSPQSKGPKQTRGRSVNSRSPGRLSPYPAGPSGRERSCSTSAEPISPGIALSPMPGDANIPLGNPDISLDDPSLWPFPPFDMSALDSPMATMNIESTVPTAQGGFATSHMADVNVPSTAYASQTGYAHRTLRETPWETAMICIDKYPYLSRTAEQQQKCLKSLDRDYDRMSVNALTQPSHAAVLQNYVHASQILRTAFDILEQQPSLTKEAFTSGIVHGGQDLWFRGRDDPNDAEDWKTAWKRAKASDPGNNWAVGNRISHYICENKTDSDAWVG